MPKISGLGGLFFRAQDPEMLARWYEERFGINSKDTGYIWFQEAGPTVFSPFPAETDYFGRREQAFMLNFRVTDVDDALEELRAAGVRIDDQRMDEPYGRFAGVYDPEGNKIELWEPRDGSA